MTVLTIARLLIDCLQSRLRALVPLKANMI